MRVAKVLRLIFGIPILIGLAIFYVVSLLRYPDYLGDMIIAFLPESLLILLIIFCAVIYGIKKAFTWILRQGDREILRKEDNDISKY